MVQAGVDLRLMAVQAKGQKDGFFMAFVPAHLNDEQVQAALDEAGVEPQQLMEIGEWTTTSQHVMLAFVPYSPIQLAKLLEPSRS